ncbi:HAD family hydrolase [Oceanobacillus piezotolerans]|uniref:HAD family hydrolase n=1 Tax=Oceanobacillus piezotolerans TaxID=2448030 RepID=A0A498D1Z6_9BACI|nr:HAD family hydrolase [Oceanobacillus piezotolerans]RLL41170.1 HAD family hydrolase [Oceanobacillus piezotolerans]
MIKAVIFDFDGLILDTETPWYEAYKEVLRTNYKYDLLLEDFVKCVGSSDTILFNYLKEQLENDVDLNDISLKAKAIHSEKIKEINARDGVEDYLKEATELGLKIVLASSSTKEWVTSHLTKLNFISYFDHLITQDDVENVKPSSDLFLKAIDVLKVDPSEAIVFEDSLNGLIAAQKADLRTIIVPNQVTEKLPFENYHLKINSMKDMSLQKLLETL